MKVSPRFALVVAAVALVVPSALQTGAASGDEAGAIPDALQVYDAQSAATPLGIVSRVPAETAGGTVYAQSRVEIGKAQGSAAGGTLGPLGDAFVLTSVPVPGFAIPAQVTAQFPPSPFAPSEAKASTNVSTGPASIATFTASAKDPANAVADAIGGAGGQDGLVRIAGGTSHSESRVLSDGTVLTTATSSVNGITIGPAGVPIVSISGMTSSASVRVPLGGAPVHTLEVKMSGALVGGVPVEITQDGIKLAGSLPVPATGIATINLALTSLEKQGLSIQAVPVVTSVTDVGATVSGAALQIGYKVPGNLSGQLPTNIGTDETFLLGQVQATATGRKRVPLNIDPPPAIGNPGNPPANPSGGGGIPPIPAAPSFSGSGGGLASVPTPPAAVTPSAPAAPAASDGASLFSLPARARDVASEKFLLGYRIFLITAVVMVGAYLLTRRSNRFA